MITKEHEQRIVEHIIREFLIPKIKELDFNATGELINSLEARGNEIWGNDYFKFIADGRGPNEHQSHESLAKFAIWASEKFVRNWAIARGISEDLVFPIAYKIGRDGTNFRPRREELIQVLEGKEVQEYLASQYREVVIKELTLNFREMFK